MRVIIIFTVLFMACAYGRVTPDYFPQCKRSDPEIEKCLLQGVEAMRPHLKAGIPEANIPALEPFIVPTLKLNRTAPNLQLKATVRNAKAYGGSAFKIEKLKLNLNNKYAAEIKVTIPILMVTADFDVRGSKILALDINGLGKIRGNFSGITVIAKGLAKPITKDGVEYLQAEKVVTRVRINGAEVAFKDTDRPLAAASAESFFNANPGVVLDILTPLIEETAAVVVKTFINKMLGTVPLNELLSE